MSGTRVVTTIKIGKGRVEALHSEEFPTDKIMDDETLKIERWTNIEFNNQSQFWEVTPAHDSHCVLFKNKFRKACLKYEHDLYDKMSKEGECL